MEKGLIELLVATSPLGLFFIFLIVAIYSFSVTIVYIVKLVKYFRHFRDKASQVKGALCGSSKGPQTSIVFPDKPIIQHNEYWGIYNVPVIKFPEKLNALSLDDFHKPLQEFVERLRICRYPKLTLDLTDTQRINRNAMDALVYVANNVAVNNNLTLRIIIPGNEDATNRLAEAITDIIPSSRKSVEIYYDDRRLYDRKRIYDNISDRKQ